MISENTRIPDIRQSVLPPNLVETRTLKIWDWNCPIALKFDMVLDDSGAVSERSYHFANEQVGYNMSIAKKSPTTYTKHTHARETHSGRLCLGGIHFG